MVMCFWSFFPIYFFDVQLLCFFSVVLSVGSVASFCVVFAVWGRFCGGD